MARIYSKTIKYFDIPFRVLYTAYDFEIEIKSVHCDQNILRAISDPNFYIRLRQEVSKQHKDDLQEEADQVAVDRFRDYKEALEHYVYNGKNEP